MPLRSILQTAHALSYYMRRQEIVANNLANASSTAFKGDRIAAHLSADGPWPEAVASLDLRQGNQRETGRPLDLALEGAGFLVVRTPEGDRLSRGGSLSLDPGGILTDGHGHPVLGQDGPIVLAGTHIKIEADGTVLSGGEPAGRLRLVTVADPATLAKRGSGHFATEAALLPADAVMVRQGMLEEANVEPTTGMVDLISIQRAWAANLEVVRTMDSVLGTVTGEVGKV
ncbi:MAG: flagellar hook basal-body protein [Gemmatimonadales bacterium]|nr:flagellar hook basal-body protein [Gemmatimonadales bacterium]